MAKEVSIIENLTNKGLLFDVVKMPTSDLMGGIVTTSDNEYSVVGMIGDQRRLLNVCSDTYNLKPNAEIFPVLEQKFKDAGIHYEEKYRHINYNKFYGDYALKGFPQSIGKKDDIIFPRVFVNHSYNGKTQLTLGCGLYRLVCSNGLVIPYEGAERSNFTQTVKHTDKLDIVFARFLGTVEMMLEEYQKGNTIENFRTFAERPVLDVKERIEQITDKKNPKAVTKFPTATLDLALEIIQRETNNLGYRQANDWLVYNALNEALYSPKSNIHPEFKQVIDAQVFDFMMSN
jgi:transposase-like protein